MRWGKEVLSHFCRGQFDSLERIDSFRKILELDFQVGFDKIRRQVQTVQERADRIVEKGFTQLCQSLFKGTELDDTVVQKLEGLLPDETVQKLLKGLIPDETIKTQLETGGDNRVTVSRKDLITVQTAFSQSKDLLPQIEELTTTVLEMLDTGIQALTKSLNFLKPAVQAMKSVSSVAKDLSKDKPPAANDIRITANAAIARLSSLSRALSPEFEAKIREFNLATPSTSQAEGGELRKQVLNLIEEECDAGATAPQTCGSSDVLGSGALNETKPKRDKLLLRLLVFLLSGKADEEQKESTNAAKQAEGEIISADGLLVLGSAVECMVIAQSIIEQNIKKLESAKKDVEGTQNELDAKIQAEIKNSLAFTGNTLKTSGEDVEGDTLKTSGEDIELDISQLMLGGIAIVSELAKTTNFLRSQGHGLLSACDQASRTMGGMQYRPITVSGAAIKELNGPYRPTPLHLDDKPIFLNGPFVLSYQVRGKEPEKQGWSVGKAALSDAGDKSAELESDCDLQLPHFMDEDYSKTAGKKKEIKWTNSQKDTVPVKIQVVSPKLSGNNDIDRFFTDPMRAKLRDASDGVTSAAQDLLNAAFTESEAAYNDAKNSLDLTEVVEDLGEIQVDVPGLLAQFQPDLFAQFEPLQSIGLVNAGWLILQQESSQKELYRVRATSFFVLAQLQACLTSAIEARDKAGIGGDSRLDMSAALRAVNEVLVRMQSLETRPEMKPVFKTCAYAQDAWARHNMGVIDFLGEDAAARDLEVAEVNALIDEIAQERDPQKKVQLMQSLQSKQKALELRVQDPVIFQLIMHQAKTVANLVSHVSAAGKTAGASASAVSKDAWEGQKKLIEAELRANLAALKKRQEEIESVEDVESKQHLMMQVRKVSCVCVYVCVCVRVCVCARERERVCVCV